MPSTESIEQLHEHLTPLGDEPRVTAERGEIIEPPTRPEQGLDDDLSALLEDADSDVAEMAQVQQAEEGDTGEDTSELLSNLDSLFDDDEDEGADEAGDGAGDEPGIDLGDDDFPAPPDFTFDPDAIPDEPDTDIDFGGFDDFDDGAEEEPGQEEPDGSGGADEPGADEPDADEPDTADASDDVLGDFGDIGDFGDLGDSEDDILSAFSEDADADPFADLAALEGEGAEPVDQAVDDEGPADEGPADETPADADQPEDAAPGESGESDDFAGLGDLDDLDDLEGLDGTTEAGGGEDELGDFGDLGEDFGDLGDLGDLGDFGDLESGDDAAADAGDEFGDLDDLGDFDTEDMADAEDTAADIDETADTEDTAADTEDAAFEDLDDLDDIAADDSFGADFGEQIDEDFGDLDLDDAGLSDDPLADGGGDSFDLPSVDDEVEDLDSVDDFGSLDEEGFSLGDFGEEFDINEESIDEFAGLEDEAGGEPGESGEGGEVEEVAAAPAELAERELSDEEFHRVQQTLASLPLNVKIATEEAIGESHGTPEQINALIDQLIAGDAPSKIAPAVSKILDRKVEVPRGYQKRSGLAFEEEKETFAYRLQHVILPIVRTAMLVTVATAIVGFLGYRFVYRPIYAGVLYRQGYQEAQEDRYQLANDTFARAYELRPRDPWFSRYAELYVEKRQYQLAVEKYDQLVFGMDPQRRQFLRGKVAENNLIESVQVGPNQNRQVYELLNVDREAILKHGALQSEVLANYRRADELYRIILFGSEYDYDALLGRGDNYMRWGEEDADRFEDARQTYARLMARYGETDPILMRFLRYFVRMDNQQEVERVVYVFRNDPDAEVDPQIYANAAGFLLDKGRIADIREMLIRAYQTDPMTPEVHYELARYDHRVEAPLEERDALDNAQEAFRLAEPLTPDRLWKQIDTDIRSGEYWYQRDEILQATEDLSRAQGRYDQALDAGFLEPTPELARVYARLGDIDYYQSGDLERALTRYNRAAADGYVPDDLNYKRGFIHYRWQEYDRAAEYFFDIGATNDLAGPDNVLYARGNTLFQRQNYFGAEAFYEELLDRLQRRRDSIRTLLVAEDPSHRALVENLIRVNNNLGVAMYRAALREDPQDPDLSQALNYLRESTELRENYLRDDETGERAAATPLAFLNIRDILNPTEQYDPQIFTDLPRDMEQLEL